MPGLDAKAVGGGDDMNPWYLVIALCLVDGFLCHQLMKAWDKDDAPRDPRSRFERLKACRTPTDMVLLLNGNERRFCPKAYGAKPDECEESCGRCIVQWLEEASQ